MDEEYPEPTPTQEQLNAIQRGEAGVTDVADGDKPTASDPVTAEDVAEEKSSASKARQAKAD